MLLDKSEWWMLTYLVQHICITYSFAYSKGLTPIWKKSNGIRFKSVDFNYPCWNCSYLNFYQEPSTSAYKCNKKKNLFLRVEIKLTIKNHTPCYYYSLLTELHFYKLQRPAFSLIQGDVSAHQMENKTIFNSSQGVRKLA